jgi:cytochrome c peroxidase
MWRVVYRKVIQFFAPGKLPLPAMRVSILILSCLGLLSLTRLIGPPAYTLGVQTAVDYFKKESGAFSSSCTALRLAVTTLKTPGQLGEARKALLECRCRYKYIESFLEYFFRSSSTIYNRAPKFETEDGSMEYQSPIGLQVIESMLYETAIDTPALLQQIDAVESAAADLPALLYGLRADDRQELESLRVELIRIMALDITGYEAPLLKSGIIESRAALQSFAYQLKPYLIAGEKRSDSVNLFLDKAMGLLGAQRPDSAGAREAFDGFDRLGFMRDALLPLQKQLGLLICERGLELNTTKTLNYAADDLFSADALSPEKFPGDGAANGAIVQLGRVLFSEPKLSGNQTKSCASCHNPSKAFTDQLPVSIGFDGHQQLDRNAPTLLYSAYQFNQFWDGRVRSLEEQIRTVMADVREMRADTTGLLNRLRQDHFYDSSFRAAFPAGGADMASAIAAYVRSLHPMNSPFDRYLRHEEGRLSREEIKGANLFLGKAQCATCHFIPLFNGLIPPYYSLTEFEILGTTADDRFADTSSLRLSKDEGRYKIYPFPFLKGAFKTPTVRDAALTAPYMHNGAFRSLEKVLEFYNNGGGAGMGLDVPDQTLSSVHLNLSKEEIKDIILFIRVLTDSIEPRS